MTLPDSIEKNKDFAFSSKTPYLSTLKSVRLLNKSGSSKSTYHVVLDISDSNIEYEPGSCIGIYPANAMVIVKELLIALNCTGQELVYDHRQDQECSLENFLTHRANLQTFTSKLISLHSDLTKDPNRRNFFQSLLKKENRALLKDFIANNHLLSFLQQYSEPSICVNKLCQSLSPQLPRYYSIASSMKKVGNEVHLLVAAFTYEHLGQLKTGVTSHFLTEICKKGFSKVPIFVQTNIRFVLPKPPSTPIIMIGPGTGLAAFLGFLHEREMDPTSGDNWLFFGERNSSCDFYFEDYLKSLQKNKKLKLDVAFSRDGPEKEYVQHKMLEHGEELWNWIDKKRAHIYVSGDAKAMAKDVTATLEKIIATYGSMEEMQSKEYLKSLRKEQRFLLDVY